MAGRRQKGQLYSSDSGGGPGLMDVIGGFSEVGSATNALDKAKAAEAAQTATDAGSAAFLGSSGPIDKTPRFKLADVGKAPGKLSTFFNPKGAQEWAKGVRSALADQAQLQNEFTLRSSLAGIENDYQMGRITIQDKLNRAADAIRDKNAKDQLILANKTAVATKAGLMYNDAVDNQYSTEVNPLAMSAAKQGFIADRTGSMLKDQLNRVDLLAAQSDEGQRARTAGTISGWEAPAIKQSQDAQRIENARIAAEAAAAQRDAALNLREAYLAAQEKHWGNQDATAAQRAKGRYGDLLNLGDSMQPKVIGGQPMVPVPVTRYSGPTGTNDVVEHPADVQPAATPPKNATAAPVVRAPAVLPQIAPVSPQPNYSPFGTAPTAPLQAAPQNALDFTPLVSGAKRYGGMTLDMLTALLGSEERKKQAKAALNAY